MKFLSLTTAAALALGGSMAAAQTTTAETNRDNPPHFGETWGGTVGTQFFTDDTMGTLRSDDEIRNAWQSMTEEQRAMVTADCDLAKGTDASASGTATDNSAPSGSEGTANGVTQDNMMKLCTVIAP
ncbi:MULTISPECIES: hypothetical protein [Paracoccaceae]|jgi:predicted Fe-S protein YdhL (DUF1289 family)|uniref:hypothetical protein n=1 Tax=Paracoccaceae TaxID=31989 RepID=UPI003028882D